MRSLSRGVPAQVSSEKVAVWPKKAELERAHQEEGKEVTFGIFLLIQSRKNNATAVGRPRTAQTAAMNSSCTAAPGKKEGGRVAPRFRGNRASNETAFFLKRNDGNDIEMKKVVRMRLRIAPDHVRDNKALATLARRPSGRCRPSPAEKRARPPSQLHVPVLHTRPGKRRSGDRSTKPLGHWHSK
jgi:hypothetical protein